MFVLPASDPVKLRELSMYDNRHVCGGYFFKKVTIEPLRIRESESSCLHVRDGFSYSQGGSNVTSKMFRHAPHYLRQENNR